MVGEHTGQGTGACGSGMGQREGSAGRGAERAGGKERQRSRQVPHYSMRRFWHIVLEVRAGHGGSAVVAWGREGSAGERQEWEGGGGADSRSRRMASLGGGGA